MRTTLLVVFVLPPCLARADGGAVAKTELQRGMAAEPSHARPVCVLWGSLPTEYTFGELGRIKATKRTYGGTDELNRPIADEARRVGADVIINYVADQRFKGPTPLEAESPDRYGGRGEAHGRPALRLREA